MPVRRFGSDSPIQLPAATLIDLTAVVTELVNNAVAHGPGRPITLALLVGDETIRGEVADQGNPSAAIPDIKEASQRGSHGLKVVEKLTSRWGCIRGQHPCLVRAPARDVAKVH